MWSERWEATRGCRVGAVGTSLLGVIGSVGASLLGVIGSVGASLLLGGTRHVFRFAALRRRGIVLASAAGERSVRMLVGEALPRKRLGRARWRCGVAGAAGIGPPWLGHTRRGGCRIEGTLQQRAEELTLRARRVRGATAPVFRPLFAIKE
jgi:hypothetical protein